MTTNDTPDYRKLYFDLMRTYEKEVTQLEQIREVIESSEASLDGITNEIRQILNENDLDKSDDNNPANALTKLLATFSKIKGSRGNIQHFFDNYNMYMHELAKTIIAILFNERDPQEITSYTVSSDTCPTLPKQVDGDNLWS